jgi:deoxyribose-phosphate aldolase
MQVKATSQTLSKTYTKRDLARTFDHSILRPESSSTNTITRSAELARKEGIRALVVHPCKVSITKRLLEGSGVLTASVLGDFPQGRGLTNVRVQDVRELLEIGADEIDVVSRYERMIEGDYKGFEEDLTQIVEGVDGKILKIILEVDFLGDRLTREATEIIAKIAREKPVAKLIVKTKTGFAENKYPNLEAVKVIKDTLERTNQYAKTLDELGNGKVGIKASGGAKTREDVVSLLEAGAHIIGIGDAVFEILK